jgi:hypothetical protein
LVIEDYVMTKERSVLSRIAEHRTTAGSGEPALGAAG